METYDASPFEITAGSTEFSAGNLGDNHITLLDTGFHVRGGHMLMCAEIMGTITLFNTDCHLRGGVTRRGYPTRKPVRYWVQWTLLYTRVPRHGPRNI